MILLVENMGRVNYELHPMRLDNERKGASGYAIYKQTIVTSWLVYHLTLDQYLAPLIKPQTPTS